MIRSLLILSLLAQSAFADHVIVGPTETEPYTLAVFSADVQSGAGIKTKYIWRFPAGVSFDKDELDNRKTHVTALPGTYGITLLVTQVINGEPNGIIDDFVWTVKGGGPVPPTPQPVVKTLADLAGDKAAALAKEYADFLAAVPLYGTTKIFRGATASRLAAVGLTDNGAAAAIAQRIDAAIGTAERPLDDALQAALADCLEKIIADLGASPTPQPGPQPSPAPIPANGLHVLIVEETDDRGRLPQGQLATLQSAQVRGYVQSKGGQFRQYDDDPPIAEPLWQAARNRPRTALPWIIVSNGAKGGIEQPLPASVDETLALIRRFE